MLNHHTYRKYKIHIHTTSNDINYKATVGHYKILKENFRNISNEYDYICHSIDNLREFIKNLLDNSIFHQVNSSEKHSNEKFQWLLNYINQLLVIYQYQYYHSKPSVANELNEMYLTTNRHQEQMLSEPIENRELLIECSRKNESKQLSDNEKIFNRYEQDRVIEMLKLMEKKTSQPDDYLQGAKQETNLLDSIFNRLHQINNVIEYAFFDFDQLANLQNSSGNSNKSTDNIYDVSSNITRLIRMFKNIYSNSQSDVPISYLMYSYLIQKKQLLKQRLIIYNKQYSLYRFARCICQRVESPDRLYLFTNQLKKIAYHFHQLEYNGNFFLCQQFFSSNGVFSNLFRIYSNELIIFNHLQETHDIQHLENYLQQYEQQLQCRISSQLSILSKPCIHHRFTQKNNEICTKNKLKLELSSNSNCLSISKTCYIDSNRSLLNIRTYCGQTYNRSTSAYTSKKKFDRYHFTSMNLNNKRDQSVPASVISHIVKKLDQENARNNSDDHIKISSNYKCSPIEKTSTNASDIYIKLSDCEAACRRWADKHKKANRYSPHRRKTTKLPICYRNFPSSFNALSTYEKLQKSCKSTSQENYQTNISVDIRKMSCKEVQTNKKSNDQFFCFGTIVLVFFSKKYYACDQGTGSIDFVDGSEGPTLCLKQENIKTEKQIYLYRRVLHDDAFNYESGDERKPSRQFVHSSVLNDDNESSFENNLKPFNNVTPLSTCLLEDDKDYYTNETSISTTYCCPSAAIKNFNIVHACVLIITDVSSKVVMLQTPYLPSIIPNSDMRMQSILKTCDQDFHSQNVKRYLLNDQLPQSMPFINPQTIDEFSNIVTVMDQSIKRFISTENRSEDDETLDFDAEISLKFSLEENQISNSFENISLRAQQSSSKILDQFNSEMPSSLLIKPSQSSFSTKIMENSIDLSEFIDIRCSAESDKEHQSMTTPTCVPLSVSFEYLVHKKSDSILSTVVTQTQTFLSSTKNPISSSHKILQNMNDKLDDKTNDPITNNDMFHVNVIPTDENAILARSTLLLSNEPSSNLKHPPLMSASQVHKKTSSNDKSRVLLHHLNKSILDKTESACQQLNDEQKMSRNITISRKSNDLNVQRKQKRYAISQCKMKNIVREKPIIDTSSSIITHKKQIRKNRICTRPPWVSVYTNPPTNTSLFRKSIKRASLSFKQLKDSSQILQSYTQFQCLHHPPNDSLPSCPMIKITNLCDAHLI
ncbi:hypothetical protein I4U23_029340 [Adineta vaga]|nr:hypothetical protein I4U23_029340 [Adineta vaga]